MGYLGDSLLSLFSRKVGFIYKSGDNTWSQRSGYCAGASALVERGLESSGSVVVAHGIVLAACGLLLVGLATSQYVRS